MSFDNISMYSLGAVQRSFVDSIDDSGIAVGAVSSGVSTTGSVGSPLVSFASPTADSISTVLVAGMSCYSSYTTTFAYSMSSGSMSKSQSVGRGIEP